MKLDELNMHYVLIKENDEITFNAYNQRTQPSDIRSISKTILTLACGIVSDQHPDFNENTFIYPIIKDIIHLENQNNLQYLKKIQVKHLLTHTIGYTDVLLMRKDIKDMDPFSYVDYLINHPIHYQPGEYYLYSNAGFYLLSVVLQEYLKQDLFKYIDTHLFKKLNITDVRWEKYGNYLAGATRLWMKPHDLLKIGELFLNNGQPLISSHWFNLMLLPSNPTPNQRLSSAYGHGLLIGKNDYYFASGTGGQFLVMHPKKKMIIVTLAEQSDITLIEYFIETKLQG